jgi:hypothetical protein
MAILLGADGSRGSARRLAVAIDRPAGHRAGHGSLDRRDISADRATQDSRSDNALDLAK